jgi:syntaxin-binding protein 1
MTEPGLTRDIATEDRVFNLQTPSSFFTFFGSLGGAASGDLAVSRIGTHHCAFAVPLTLRQLLNVLATLNENPYIRYYQPAHHQPLGPLAPSSHSSSLAPPQPQPQSLRWRSAMGGKDTSVGQPQGEYLSRRLAMQVQNDLDEYMANNPEFPVSPASPAAHPLTNHGGT